LAQKEFPELKSVNVRFWPDAAVLKITANVCNRCNRCNGVNRAGDRYDSSWWGADKEDYDICGALML